MRLALAQYALDPEIWTNLRKVLDCIERAQQRAAQLILFPELCLSPFFPRRPGQDASRYTMALEDEAIKQIQAVCQRLRIAASPNIYLREGERLFDASLMIADDGRVIGVSKMVHIAQLPRFYEQDYYTPSDAGFRVHELPFGKVGVVVCFDRHYPESIRTCVLRGATLIIIPTANTVDEPNDLYECELRAAALQNGVYIAMCNRVGREGTVVFCGQSTVVDPYGNIVGKGNCSEDLVIADIDLGQVEAARSKRPYLTLRRPDSYEH
jgi:predicted amidohydrolase